MRDERILQLEEQLRKHAIQYYDLDNPEISDIEYDQLEQEYKDLTGEHFHYLGSISTAFGPVPHPVEVKSLEKINTIEQCREQLKRLAPGIIEPKYDGLTVMIYPSGVMATRGSGTVGEDITHTASKFIEPPRCGYGRFNHPVRGEAFLNISDFDRINEDRINRGKEPYKNLRNAMAGMLRNKDDKEVWINAQFVAYNLLGSPLSETEQLLTLSNLYSTPSKHSFKFTKETIEEAIDFISNFDRSGLDFEIDGLVIKNDSRNSMETFGETGHHYKNAVAYKFPSQGKWTTLRDVEWTVGRTGKIVPNAVLEPMQLLNATVAKSTLHNASYLSRLTLTKGCEVFVVKSNDVIPGVVNARNHISDDIYEEPRECPRCSKPVNKVYSEENEGVYQLYCENPLCESRVIERLIHMCKKENLDIDGVQIRTAEKLLESLIEKPTDIFNLNVRDIEYGLPGFGKKSAENLYNSIQKAKSVSLGRFLSSAGIPLVGNSKSRDIAEHFLTYESLMLDIKEKNCSGVSHIRGIGETVVQSIEENYHYWEDLRKYVTPIDFIEKKVSATQLTFVITGSFQDQNGVKVNRKELEKRATDAGHKVTGSVSRKTDYVIVGEKAGSKATKAEQLGITMITCLDDYFSLLK